MRVFRLLCCLALLFPAVVFAQTPPNEARTVDGTVKCLPAFTFQFPNGSLSCPTVDGKPAANIVLGATPGSVPWSNVTGGSSTQTKTMTTGGSLRPTAGGVIEANELNTGTANLPALTLTTLVDNAMLMGTGVGAGAYIPVNICNQATEKMIFDGNAWLCVPEQGGASTAWATLTPGNNATSGTFQFSGPALFRVDSQIRIPASTTPPLVDNELKIDTDADGTVIAKPMMTYRSGGTNFTVPATATAPAAQLDVLTYNLLGQDFIWQRPATVCVSAVDTSCNYLSNKLVAGANITLTPSGAGNETLTIASTGGGASDFGSLTSGTNTQAAMTVGTGASMNTSGTGTIVATSAAAATTTPTLCPAGQYSRGVDGSFNATGCTIPPGTGSGTPGGAINALQTNLDNSAFRGSTRWSIDPADGDALKSTCVRGTLDDCLNTATSVPVSQTTPTNANEFGWYVKQTGTVYEWCWSGNGDTGERCVDGTSGGGVMPQKNIVWDAASCTAAATATTNMDFDPNAATPTAACVTGTNASMGALVFTDAPANNTCVQRKTRLAQEFDTGQSISLALDWTGVPITGTVEWSAAIGCLGNDETVAALTFNAATPAVTTISGTANGKNTSVMSGLDQTGCAPFETLVARVCRISSVNGTATITDDVNLLQISLVYNRS